LCRYNTPPCTAIYTAGLVFKWALAQGGVVALEEKSKEKALLVYSTLESHSDVFVILVDAKFRSNTNLVFRTVEGENADKRFVSEAEKQGEIQNDYCFLVCFVFALFVLVFCILDVYFVFVFICFIYLLYPYFVFCVLCILYFVCLQLLFHQGWWGWRDIAVWAAFALRSTTPSRSNTFTNWCSLFTILQKKNKTKKKNY
jgi:hypothetical protein